MQPLTGVNSPEDQMLLKGIIGDRSLSATSKKAYAMRLRFLASKRRKPILDIILEADQSLAWLCQTYSELCTRKGIISAVLATVRRCPPKLALRLQKAQQIWLQELILLDHALQQRYKSNLPTARQAAGHVPWANIVRLRDKLPRGSKARLLLCMYSLGMAPMRADYNRAVLLSFCGETDLLDADLQRVAEENFLVLPKQQCRGRPAMLYLREYKTSARRGVYKRALHPKLTTEIQASLIQEPRQWLVQGKGNKPYTAKQFSKWACKTLRSLFGKPLTLTGLRHSFLSSLEWTVLSRLDREEIARNMAHSVDQQELYRFVSLPSKVPSKP